MNTPGRISALVSLALLVTGANLFAQGLPPVRLPGGLLDRWEYNEVLPKWTGKASKCWLNDEDDETVELDWNMHRGYFVVKIDGEKLRLFSSTAPKPFQTPWVLKNDFVRMQEAVPYFTGRLDANPQDAHAIKCRGWASYCTNLADDALRDATALLKLSPKDPDIFHLRALAYSRKKEYALALKECDRITAMLPKKTWPLELRADILIGKADRAGAVAEYTKALALDPKNSRLYSLRADQFAFLRQFEKELADLKKFAQLTGAESSILLRRRGTAKANSGDIDGALEDIESAMLQDLDNNWLRYLNACLLFVKKGKRCHKEFAGIRDDDETWSAYSRFAALYCHLAARQDGQAKLAATELEVASKILAKPLTEFSFEDVLKKAKPEIAWPHPLGQYLSGKLNAKDALAKATTDGQKTEAHCLIGVHLYLDGKTAEARTHFEWVREKGDTSYADFTIAVGLLARMEKENPPKTKGK